MAYLSQRRLIRLGRGTLVMTLPKAWVDYMKLKAGDKVEVKINRKLTVTPATKSE